jgi:hypothetical protein
MPSYVRFRDVGAVIVAGQELDSLGTELKAATSTKTTYLAGREKEAIGSMDSYSEPFWKDTYAHEGRNTTLYENANRVAGYTADIGKDVVKATKTLLWTDAVHGAAMYPA